MLNLNEVECADNRRVSEEEINSLAASIGNVGLLQPLVLAGKADGAGLRVVAGRRRYRALMKLKRYELPETDYRILDAEDPELVSFVENFERVPLAIDEEMAQLSLLRERYSPAEIGTLLGKSESFVRRRLQLSTLIPEFQKALAEDAIPNWRLAHYTCVSRYPADVQTTIWKGYYRNYSYGTIKQFFELLERDFGLLLATASFDRAECANCMNRSGAEGLLFEEFRTSAAQDRCLDRACYERKREAAIVETAKKLKAEPKPIALVNAAPEKELPKELRKTAHVDAAEVDILERDVAPEKANAFLIGGSGAGTYCRIAEKTKSAAADVPKGKTLGERRAELAKRREKRAQLLFAEDLLRSEPGKPVLPTPDDVRLLRWIAAMGCGFIKYQYSGIDGTSYTMKLGTDALRDGIWNNILTDVGNRLKARANESTLECFKPDEAIQSARVLGVEWADFVTKATEEIPEPKSWKDLEKTK